ncbi:NADH:flavin oxidoreductase/NADH oxidase family protein [Marinibaculum pumilum]|uniref:NADH:flavin oxidoreductase/NADH oxidase family protein n=1 Tax=Marinibaculum pumilum TaxID=1766165 RepID=A0ABV7L1L6_9PROT
MTGPDDRGATTDLAAPLDLPCGVRLANRLAKAPLTEGLADSRNAPTVRHERLYRRWSAGGCALLVTGNVLVDRRYLERPGNVVIEDGAVPSAGLEAYARAGTSAGNHLWMQINHAGRQTPEHLNPTPVGPSAVPLKLKGGYGAPRALEAAEIADIVDRFAFMAGIARETGFTGVQIHAAHGYLLSEFLSPLANRREDEWGGPLENRARLLLETVAAVRRRVGADFPVSVKLNSADFQKGGFSHAECLQVVGWLNSAGVDLLEISGGNYEQPSMMGVRVLDAEGQAENAVASVAASTAAREAYFLDYAASIAPVATTPLMVTGGFRTAAGMAAALASGAADVIGLGRPLCAEPDLAKRLLSCQADGVPLYENAIQPKRAGMPWFALQLLRMGDGLDPDLEMEGETAERLYRENELAAAAALADRTAA